MQFIKYQAPNVLTRINKISDTLEYNGSSRVGTITMRQVTQGPSSMHYRRSSYIRCWLFLRGNSHIITIDMNWIICRGLRSPEEAPRLATLGCRCAWRWPVWRWPVWLRIFVKVYLFVGGVVFTVSPSRMKKVRMNIPLTCYSQ